MEDKKLEEIKEYILEFFDKMTMPATEISMESHFVEKKHNTNENSAEEKVEVVKANIKTKEPQILIGQQGQTLLETQKLLRLLLNKKFQNNFYFDLDIDNYKNKKVEYLKNLADDYANQVVIYKKEKRMSPMSSYERRIIHGELSNRKDIIVESEGEGLDRHIVIKPF